MDYRRIRRRAHQILEKARPGDTASSVCDAFILSLIALNILVIMLETVPNLHNRFGREFAVFELVSVIIFSIEYALRLWVSVESEFRGSPLRKRLRYTFSLTALIDLAAILPFYLAILPIDMRFLRAVRLMRIFRVFKIGRYSNSIGTMVRVFRKKRDDLLVTLAVILILLIVVATTMFHIENAAQPDVFANIFQAMWWGIVTVTGVGYGDMYPVTLAGKVLGGLIALLGIVTIALPIGILGAAYVEALDSSLITSCILHPNISPIIYDLLTVEGKQLKQATVAQMGLEGEEITYRDARRRALERNVTLLGYITPRGDISLAPSNAQSVSPEYRLVYIE